MALTPPPLSEIFNQLKGFADETGLRQDLDKNSKALMQTLLAKLDVVTREEFDAQRALLSRAQDRIAALEQELETLELANKNKAQ
jgi:BMFP domain-containing protein YqiC